VYVRPFPDAGQAKYQVSTAGGFVPLWAPDGRTLYYFTLPGQVMAVEVLPGSTFTRGQQRALYTAPDLLGLESSWDISPDGQRFVAIRSRGLGSDNELVLVKNFGTELNERVR